MIKLTSEQLQTKIWDECKRIIKNRYGNDCYTCDATDLKGSNRHTGHMIPKKYLPYQFKFDIRFLRPQCYNCNMNLGGMGAIYLNNLIDEYTCGAYEVFNFIIDVKNLKKLQKENTPKQKEVIEFYNNLLEEYKKL